jgi:uncharacterized protein (DUF4415 family)
MPIVTRHLKDIKPISKKRVKEILSIPDADIDFSEVPRVDSEFFANAELVEPLKKSSLISIRIDNDTLKWFQENATKKGLRYQTFINRVLKTFAYHQNGKL